MTKKIRKRDVKLFVIPKEAFYANESPHSIILYPGQLFNDFVRDPDYDDHSIDPDSYKRKPGANTYWQLSSYWTSKYDNTIFITKVPCVLNDDHYHDSQLHTNPRFVETDCLTINTRTGEWLLRKPFSDMPWTYDGEEKY